jgi:hypothetical protein
LITGTRQHRSPIEQKSRGTPDLGVQLGRPARRHAIFDINSDTATDLALTNKAIRRPAYLPTNISPPTVSLRDQPVGRRHARAYSKKPALETGALRDE